VLIHTGEFKRYIIFRQQMLRTKFKWYVLLAISSLVLIWRLVDFSYELAYEGFHITRGGFELKGSGAGAIEIAIILAIIALIWKVLKNLLRLHSANSSR